MADSPLAADARARLIAFYLPQMYPIPENDRWWGPGFTEWTSVAEAQPLFAGHRQPRVPADLGFYDLRLPESRIAQADLARAHGIEAFCYWHYWFSGKRLLDRPFAEVLGSGEPDFPFCLAWANQPWTDTWLGSGRALQDQHYSHDDDVRHAQFLATAFADPRYVRVDGRPLFAIYRPSDLPDPARTVETLRGEAARLGVGEPLVLGIDGWAVGHDFRADGLDGTISFAPRLDLLPHNNYSPLLARPWRKVARTVRNARQGVGSTTLKVYDYRQHRAAVRQMRAGFTHPYYPTTLVGWDNTPRRGKAAVVMLNDDPEHFADDLAELVEAAAVKPFDDRLVFVNAWNEWAEGNYLEPDSDRGSAMLEAVARVNAVDERDVDAPLRASAP
ncbi:MAG: glycoside hydrolase family 99-like domain-containing protein [Acidimicrobiia bacterium]|jgi:lipopolysaccharide biosynthesis protein